MPQLITKNFRTFFANSFINSLADADTTLYAFIGKSTPWSNENSPDTPANNVISEKDAWHDMISLKKINSNDMKLVVPRVNWAPGVRYTRYDDKSTNLIGSNFYVLVLPQYRVYLCIDNNNDGLSVIKPSGINTNIFTTADGYKWKYLYSLSDSDILKFLTNSYMPVNIDENVSSTTVGGEIRSFEIINSGNNYNNAVITIKGNGVSFEGTPVLTNKTVTSISITNPGYGYTYAEAIITGNGSNANVRPILTPIKGHGKKVIEDLGVKHVLINCRFNYAEGAEDFPIVNDYRRIGLIKNPLNNQGNLASNATLSATGKITARRLTGSFILDEKFSGNVNYGNGIILSANLVVPNIIIKYTTPKELFSGNYSFSVNEGITGQNSSAFARVLRIEPPEVQKYSGEVLYIENREKITRSYDQSENVHIVIEF